MTNSIDFRVKPGFFTHFKTGRLENALGYEGIVKLLRLWGWAAEHRPSGTLTGMTGDDIEFAVAWSGQKGSFVSALISIGWLDVMPDGVFCLHDWQEHNPWVAGAPLRSDMGRMGKLASNYPELYAKFAAAGIRSISKKDYEREVFAYKMGQNQTLSNSSDPCAPTPSPRPNNDLNDLDQPNQQNNLVEEPKAAAANNEDIPHNMIPLGMTEDEVRKIRQEIRNKPDFTTLPLFLQEAAVRVTPFTIAKEREQKRQLAPQEVSPSLHETREFTDLLRKTKAAYRSFPGYYPTKNEEEWLITLCQDAGKNAYTIIKEAQAWVGKRKIPVKNPRGFISEWVKRVLEERKITGAPSN